MISNIKAADSANKRSLAPVMRESITNRRLHPARCLRRRRVSDLKNAKDRDWHLHAVVHHTIHEST
jgi:hypothetical protein